MVDDDVQRRLERLEYAVDNGRFVRRETYEADQKAQERTDIAQERRFADANDRIDEVRDGLTWLQRQLIIMLLGIIATATIAALAMRAAS